ncbi:MAG: uracil phosphoribosyltransferase [Blastochloris sp.]|nr:uracil phosphoribosyltransferase [Blastochloris sp.]
MKNLRLLDHALLSARMTRLREWDLGTEDFAREAGLVGRILAVEASRHLSSRARRVRTPLEETEGSSLARLVCLVPVLRAGLALLEPFRELLPEASVGHIGIARDEHTLEARIYVERLPGNLADCEVFLLDPMLATGHSSAAALSVLKKAGARPEHLKLVCCVAAPEGVEVLNQEHPGVEILSAALDRKLNERGFILPGLGDFGDRLFGTI